MKCVSHIVMCEYLHVYNLFLAMRGSLIDSIGIYTLTLRVARFYGACWVIKFLRVAMFYGAC